MQVLFLKYWPLEVGGKNNWEGKVYLQSSEPQITLIEGFMSCLQNALELHSNFSCKKDPVSVTKVFARNGHLCMNSPSLTTDEEISFEILIKMNDLRRLQECR